MVDVVRTTFHNATHEDVKEQLAGARKVNDVRLEAANGLVERGRGR
jgi:hypothetical protein